MHQQLYDQDRYAWAMETARLVREGRFDVGIDRYDLLGRLRLPSADAETVARLLAEHGTIRFNPPAPLNSEAP